MQRLRKKVRTVRQYGCERDLNLWIVDSLCEPAEHIAQPRSQSRATEVADSTAPDVDIEIDVEADAIPPTP